MTRAPRSVLFLLVSIACLGGLSCQLRRPDVSPVRTIEPQLIEPARHDATAASAWPVRLVDAQSRAHIGRRLIHQLPGGELAEDPVWRWSSAPDRYLDTALRLELEARPDLRHVDSATVPALAVTLLTWHLESDGSTRLVGAIEVTVTETDRVVHTQVVRRSEPVSAVLPGDLAAASGRLLRGLAADGLSIVTRK